MRILITTQAVDSDDPILGFFHRWIEEFAKHCERVTVVCLREGKHELPANVRIHSLGKFKNQNSKIKSKVRYAFKFIFLVWKLRAEYDAVFVHMNPEYIVLGGKWWRLMGKRVGLWYVHKQVDWKLRIAALFANVIFTASNESFRLPTHKLHVMGHGIDAELFSCPDRTSAEPLRILTVGRIAPAKRIDLLLRSLEVLRDRGVAFTCRIVGAAVLPEDKDYEHCVRNEAADLAFSGHVQFLGAKTQAEVAKLLCEADVFVNLSTTGSLDKAVLEAAAAGAAPASSNEAFRAMLAPHNLFIKDDSPEGVADALQRAQGADTAALREMVAHDHSLARLIPAIIAVLQS